MSPRKGLRAAAHWLLLGLGAFLYGCDLPRDPRDTLLRVQGDTMRVGYVVDPPWVKIGAGGDPDGIEPRLVRAFARQVDAEIAWVPGTEQELMERLADYDLDLVIGGLSRSNAWSRHVAMSVPYYGETHQLPQNQHVMAVPRGENRWLVTLERFLLRARPLADHLVAEVHS